MGAIRTHKFANHTFTTDGSHVLFTCPAGHRAVVKWSSILTTDASPNNIGVFIAKPGGDIGLIQYISSPGPSVLYAQAECYAVLDEGDELIGYLDGTTGSASFISAGGVLFEL